MLPFVPNFWKPRREKQKRNSKEPLDDWTTLKELDVKLRSPFLLLNSTNKSKKTRDSTKKRSRSSWRCTEPLMPNKSWRRRD